MNKSGYNHNLKYTKEKVNCNKKSRKRKIIWFNPPYNMNLETNIGEEFLKLIDIHFPKDHKLYKIINRKNIKVSYSCTPNINSIISTHNRCVGCLRRQGSTTYIDSPYHSEMLI